MVTSADPRQGATPHEMPGETTPDRRRRPLVRAGALVGVLAILALSGPRARVEPRWEAAEAGADVAERLARSELAVAGVRPGDEAAVVWADPDGRARTPVSLVYLHGFSADRHEIEPVVSRVAQALGANVVFTRLRGHGRDGAAMAEATAEDWLDDTARAFAAASALGERVVLVGTSTGGTLATWAATREETRGRLAALVLLSPNYHPRDRTSRVLLWPWGGWIARAVVGPERCFAPVNAEQEAHWTTCYPTRALLPMMALVEAVRTMDVSAVEVPTLVVYGPRDAVVDARETERVVALMTGADVRTVPFDRSADPSGHVPAGDIVSPATTEEMVALVADFLVETLGVAVTRVGVAGGEVAGGEVERGDVVTGRGAWTEGGE